MAYDWDNAYRKGDWDRLRRRDEELRYIVLAGCVAGPDREWPKRILDLGCGIGILRDHLPADSVEQYTGIDWSNEAVEQAHLNRRERSAFIAASIDDWVPEGRYDEIVFNEVLYYLPQPLATVERYRTCLESGGTFVISMWHPALADGKKPTNRSAVHARLDHGRIWRQLSRRYDVVADIVAKRDALHTWRVQQLHLRAR